MINQSLISFIKIQLALGLDKEKISKDLFCGGWDKIDIEEGFKVINDPTLEKIDIPDNNLSNLNYSIFYTYILICIQGVCILGMSVILMLPLFYNPSQGWRGFWILSMFWPMMSLLVIFSINGYFYSKRKINNYKKSYYVSPKSLKLTQIISRISIGLIVVFLYVILI